MPIYMKVEGIKGPVEYDGKKEWIELQSCQLGTTRSVKDPSGAGANREATAPSVSEIVVTKDLDAASTDLVRLALWGDGKKVTIVFVKADKGAKPEEILRIELENTLIANYSVSGHGGTANSQPMESLALNFTKITYKRGSPAHAGLMVRPEDWGSLKAASHFSRTAGA